MTKEKLGATRFRKRNEELGSIMLCCAMKTQTRRPNEDNGDPSHVQELSPSLSFHLCGSQTARPDLVETVAFQKWATGSLNRDFSGTGAKALRLVFFPRRRTLSFLPPDLALSVFQ